MIQHLEEYIQEINKINNDWGTVNATTHAWYRGQSDYSWDLRPSIYRGQGDGENERELIRDFKLNASRFLQHLPDSDFDWMYLMQHYGIPTRLLDWTESYLVALYFAVLDYSSKKDAVVWVLAPWSLNMCNLDQRSVPIDSHPALKDYLLNLNPENFSRTVNGEYPVALRPVRVSPRIIAQKGVFTVHGYSHDPLNSPAINKNGGQISLLNIKIDGGSKLNILRELSMAGISHSVLFPEMEGLAKEISFRYSLEYLEYESGAHHHKGF